MKKGPKPIPLEARFWAKVDRRGPNECWPWKGTRLPTGYGTLWVNEKQAKDYTHRIAWSIENGPIPAGMFACHSCDNPPCCNPAHIFVAPPAGNSADRNQKGRTSRGETHGTAKLSDADVASIHARAGIVSQENLAAEFGVRQPAISRIVNRKRWTHFQGATA